MITHQLIKDGEKNKNKVLNKKIKSNIYVTMIHGKKDEVVPVHYSKKVLNIFIKLFFTLYYSIFKFMWYFFFKHFFFSGLYKIYLLMDFQQN